MERTMGAAVLDGDGERPDDEGRGLSRGTSNPAVGEADAGVRAERRDRQGLADDDLRHRRAHLARGVPGRAGPHRRPRAGLADIASTGISAAETADVRIGQTVAVFAQGPIGLCATAGARLMGASTVIDFSEEDPVAAIKRLTEGRGVGVAIEALGTQQTFEACLEATRPGGIVSTLGVYGGKLEVPLEPFVYGIGDKKILTTLCPGGKERMR
jgi:threonine dehydrogenase-like Zn-dependent dehydrogenase